MGCGLKRRGAVMMTGLISILTPMSASAQSVEELRDMPIGALSNLDVSSVTKSATSLADAPASIYVITHDDIVRSGTLTLSGILRLAPNLQITRGGSNGTVITARGLSGSSDAQNFSNKLQVLIDGRSVYTPLFSGVYWDMQDVLPEDIERIEVISGPGATLWGTNAVNGVINIITRNAGATQGGYLTGVMGNRTYDGGARYGGRLGQAGNYRIYTKLHRNADSSNDANNDSSRIQGGFRLDWDTSASDQFMVQGDAYTGSRSQGINPDENIFGQDLVLRWNRTMPSDAQLQVQAYYDRYGRETEQDGGRFIVQTADLDIQHSFSVGSIHKVIVGGGTRLSRYNIHGTSTLFFDPAKRDLFTANVFVQDNIALTPSLTATVGLKLEHDPYTGFVILPTGRLSWKPHADTLFWAAISRALRTPTPFDRDVQEKVDTTLFLTGSPTFRSEKLTAYEAGTRLVVSSTASLSVSTFYNRYDDLRSIELAPGGFLPLEWGNGLKGYSYGLDAWADFRVVDWWRIKPGYSLLMEKFHFAKGASGLLGPSQVGNDPRHRASVRSSMDIGPWINFDADLRYVGPLPEPHLRGYLELGMRLGWQFSERAELSVSGFNLLHKRHYELPASQAAAVSRSGFVALKWHI